jgi:hypothetical protein
MTPMPSTFSKRTNPPSGISSPPSPIGYASFRPELDTIPRQSNIGLKVFVAQATS